MIVKEKIEYKDSESTYEGVFAYDQKIKGERPVVMIAHAYGGQSSFEENKAVELAELGYVGFAIDIYGKGVRAKTSAEAEQLMAQLNDNRNVLLNRMLASLDAAKSIEFGDSQKIGAIGFCFGGKCVLDLARSGIQIKGCVSFHGLFDAPDINQETKIKTPVLILHGWDDPLAQPNDFIELTKELSLKEADWEINAYGHTSHSFTDPRANMPERGIVYSEDASRKSWNRMTRFFKHRFKA